MTRLCFKKLLLATARRMNHRVARGNGGSPIRRQNSDASPKGVHVLIPRNCEYVNCMAEKN